MLSLRKPCCSLRQGLPLVWSPWGRLIQSGQQVLGFAYLYKETTCPAVNYACFVDFLRALYLRDMIDFINLTGPEDAQIFLGRNI